MLVIGPAPHRHQTDHVRLTHNNCLVSESLKVKQVGVSLDQTLSFNL